MLASTRHPPRAFSLVELVIVVLIIGIIAAIAVPRVISARKNADDAALRTTLGNLRMAIDAYYCEHNFVLPGANGDGTNPSRSQGAFTRQLTLYSDLAGKVSATKDAAHPFGPYIRDSFPKAPAGPYTGKSAILILFSTSKLTIPSPEPPNFGWIYNAGTGEIVLNSCNHLGY
jgi:prepilin-type N-terminal cleavage/methylation domain-containing protein